MKKWILFFIINFFNIFCMENREIKNIAMADAALDALETNNILMVKQLFTGQIPLNQKLSGDKCSLNVAMENSNQEMMNVLFTILSSQIRNAEDLYISSMQYAARTNDQGQIKTLMDREDIDKKLKKRLVLTC